LVLEQKIGYFRIGFSIICAIDKGNNSNLRCILGGAPKRRITDMTEDGLRKIDHSAIKMNQITIIVLSILAFIINALWIVILVAVVMLAGVIRKAPGFDFVYKYVLRPAKLVKPDILDDHPEPHRFAQLLGGLFMTAGAISLYTGLAGVGWGLVWLVIVLAALNAFAGFCVGCAFYYWLSQLKIPGFTKQPPAGSTPGMRPKGQTYRS
jgi:hypothetical protein